MKTIPAKKSALAATRSKKHLAAPASPAPNLALNNQNRRVLAQHYRAKYGVK